MDRIFKLPVGVAIFAALALAGTLGLFAFNAAPPAYAQASNADLMSLTLTEGGDAINLTPRFMASEIGYTANVPYSVDMINVAAEKAHSGASIAYDGVASGEAMLTQGANTITITVTAVDSTQKVYTVIVTRGEPSGDATLKSLKLKAMTSENPADTDYNVPLMPGFMAGRTSYAVTVANSVSHVALTPTMAHKGAMIDDAALKGDADGNEVSVSDGVHTVNLAAIESDADGDNEITIKVTAEDETTAETYTVTVTRLGEASDDATLQALKLEDDANGRIIIPEPRFTPATVQYTAEVPYATMKVKLTPMTAHKHATINSVSFARTGTATPGSTLDAANGVYTTPEVTDSAGLAEGRNVITVVVRPEEAEADGSSDKTYTVNVIRGRPSWNADLKSLMLEAMPDDAETYTKYDVPLMETFMADTTSYTATVANSVSQIALTPMTAHDGARIDNPDTNNVEGVTLTGQAVTVTDGVYTVPLADIVNEADGENEIAVQVTAEDGSTRDYTVTVTRLADKSADRNLKSLMLMAGDANVRLMPEFMAAKVNYTASVANSVTQVTVTPMTAHNHAMVSVTKGDGTSLDAEDGAYSLDLGAGADTITITVEAEIHDPEASPARIYSKNYRIEITKGAVTETRATLRPQLVTKIQEYIAASATERTALRPALVALIQRYIAAPTGS